MTICMGVGGSVVGWLIENVLGWVILIFLILGEFFLMTEGETAKDRVTGFSILGFVGLLGLAFLFD